MKSLNSVLNNMSKGSRTSIAVLLCMICGLMSLTVAYFALQIAGNPTEDTVIIESGNLSLQFEDNNPNFVMDRIVPGNSSSKALRITNTSTQTVYYALYFYDLTNSFLNGDLDYAYSCNKYTAYDVATSTGTLVGQCYAPVTGVNVPDTSESALIKQYIPIDVGETHIYNFTVTLVDTLSNQDYNQGQKMNGRIIVQESEHERPVITVDAPNTVVSNLETSYRYGYDATLTVTPSAGYTVTNVSCTNSQVGTWAENTLTVANLRSDTTCTVTTEAN